VIFACEAAVAQEANPESAPSSITQSNDATRDAGATKPAPSENGATPNLELNPQSNIATTPGDTTPGDTTPGDTTPGDTTSGDTLPTDPLVPAGTVTSKLFRYAKRIVTKYDNNAD